MARQPVPRIAVEDMEDLHFGVMPTLAIDFGEVGTIATDPRFEPVVRRLAEDADRLRDLSDLLSGTGREEVENWVKGIRQGSWDPTDATKRVLASILGAFLAATDEAGR